MTDGAGISGRIVVAGAGIGGLTTALALHARAQQALVLEASPVIHPLGVGINVQPAAIGILAGLGLGEDLERTGIQTREHRYVDQRGNTLWVEPRGTAAGHDHPQYSIHRGQLQLLLLDAVRRQLGEGAVLTDKTITEFDELPECVNVSAREIGGRCVEVSGAGLIGADGLHSVVRSQLHPNEPGINVSGIRMWRGLAELEGEFLDGRTMVVANDSMGTRLVAYPCSAVHAEAGSSLVNWVCLAADDVVTDRVRPVDRRGDSMSEVSDRLSHWNLGWLDVKDMLQRSPSILEYPMVDRDPLSSWGRGAVTLLGDAAHPMYPVGANGASQAIIDASTVSAELASSNSTESAFRRYENLRRRRTSDIVEANRQMNAAEQTVQRSSGHPGAEELSRITADYRKVVDASSPRTDA